VQYKFSFFGKSKNRLTNSVEKHLISHEKIKITIKTG